MRYHLETKHPDEYKQLAAKEKELSKEKVGGSNQPTLLESFVKSQPFVFDHPRAKEITKRIGEMMALDNEPFTMVNHIGFVRLLNLLEPRYQLPSDKYFSETLIPGMYQKVALKVKNDVSSTSYVSLTTDVWSSVAQDSYISLTCHYIARDFTQQQICLHAAPFNDRHTGEHIGAMINKCLQSWDLTDKIHVVVRDNGSNFVAGLRDAGIPNIPCLAHTLQPVVKDGCLAQPAIVDLTSKARKLVGHYKHSNVALQSLLKIQEQLGLSPKRLIQDEPTRWNTTFYMLQRLLDLKVAVTAAGAELIELSNSNWMLAEKAVKILQIYEEATREASGNYATAGVIIPVVNSIIRSLEISDSDAGVMKMKREMLKSLKDRYKHMESNEYYAIATLLDPRFKQRVFSSSSSAALAKQMLIAEHEQLEMEVTSDFSPKRARLDQDDTSAPAKKKSSLLWKYCDELMDENSEIESLPESTQSVIEKYLKEPTMPRKSDPFFYWKSNKDNLPHLASLARHYLCAPPASVASERLFSAAANICTDLRNHLSPTKVEYLLFLNKNLRTVNFD